MLNYLIRRVLFSIVVLIGISFVSFVVIELPPGDFATTYKNRLINQANMDPADAEAQEQRTLRDTEAVTQAQTAHRGGVEG